VSRCNNATIAVDRSQATDTEGDRGAVYKGLALVTTPAGKFLYATNFRSALTLGPFPGPEPRRQPCG
jgi:hypothetical protein